VKKLLILAIMATLLMAGSAFAQNFISTPSIDVGGMQMTAAVQSMNFNNNTSALPWHLGRNVVFTGQPVVGHVTVSSARSSRENTDPTIHLAILTGTAMNAPNLTTYGTAVPFAKPTYMNDNGITLAVLELKTRATQADSAVTFAQTATLTRTNAGYSAARHAELKIGQRSIGASLPTMTATAVTFEAGDEFISINRSKNTTLISRPQLTVPRVLAT
jgi:hypothetical protein